MNILELEKNDLAVEVNSIAEFLAYYTKGYPGIDEKAFVDHLSVMEEHWVFD